MSTAYSEDSPASSAATPPAWGPGPVITLGPTPWSTFAPRRAVERASASDASFFSQVLPSLVPARAGASSGSSTPPWPAPPDAFASPDPDKDSEEADPAAVARRIRAEELTTVMVRNMPNRVWAADFAQTLDSIGFEDLYDLCLVPIDPTSGRGKGYAFVNFNTPESAAALCDVLEALPAEHVSGRRLHVAVARIQGAEATLAMRGPPKPGKKRKRWDLFVAPGSLAQRAVQAEEC